MEAWLSGEMKGTQAGGREQSTLLWAQLWVPLWSEWNPSFQLVTVELTRRGRIPLWPGEEQWHLMLGAD